MALAPLGVQVLSRGVVFIDLALAQAAAAAALWVSVVMHDSNAVTTQIFAALGALLCAGFGVTIGLAQYIAPLARAGVAAGVDGV
ncbi:MAG: hypothetical protein K2X63_02715, partial [Burkholderiaceae bacterium]|nr:hypothetical protein [Burkholderiaceae bacterium]